MEHISITFIARDQSTAIEQLMQLTAKAQCYVEESRCTMLGNQFAGILRISGNWNAINKFESYIIHMEPHDDIHITIKRTKPFKLEGEFLPYMAQIVALDTPDLLFQVVSFFDSLEVCILDLQTDPFKTSHTDTTMLTLSIRMNIPAQTNIADLRERFMVLCDELNIDGIIEPEKR